MRSSDVLAAVVLFGAGAMADALRFRGSGSPPHIIMFLVDDLGWNSVYNNERTITPFIDRLARDEGVKLTSHYTYSVCAPSRGSLMTGRYPFTLEATRNNLLPVSTPEGIDLRYNMLPKHLAKANYYSVHIGKWHLGQFTDAYTPVSRGFDHSFGFLSGAVDYYTSKEWTSASDCKRAGIDLSFGWSNGTTVRAAVGAQDDVYGGILFAEYAAQVIRDHAGHSEPLFMYLALPNTHVPLVAPQMYLDRYKSFDEVTRDPNELTLNAMVTVVDDAAENVTTALKETGMWADTLFVWTTDNGAPVRDGGSNHPLRGGKGNCVFEGAMRTPTFVTGGRLPAQMRGRELHGMAHISDWYATFSALAGLGGNADSEGPAPANSHDLSGWLFGQDSESPRKGVVYDHRMYTDEEMSEPTGAIRIGDLKLVVGDKRGMSQATWFGLFSPNISDPKPEMGVRACPQWAPCLFNVTTGADIEERQDLAKERPDDVAWLLGQWRELRNYYHPARSPPEDDIRGYCNAIAENSGFVKPWL